MSQRFKKDDLVLYRIPKGYELTRESVLFHNRVARVIRFFPLPYSEEGAYEVVFIEEGATIKLIHGSYLEKLKKNEVTEMAVEQLEQSGWFRLAESDGRNRRGR